MPRCAPAHRVVACARSLLGLGGHTRAGDLLDSGHGKQKGLLKSGAQWRVGKSCELHGEHADGSPLKLEVRRPHGRADRGGRNRWAGNA